MNDEEKAAWEKRTTGYAERFDWWWRGEGWKRAVEIYSLTPPEYQSSENYDKLWEELRRAALNYERCARRQHGRKRENVSLYEHEVCFYKLRRPLMENLVTRWPSDFVIEAKTKKRVARSSLLDDRARPSNTDLALLTELSRNDEQLYPKQGLIRELADEMLARRAEVKQRLSGDGWTIPRWMRFDLRAPNGEICQDFKRWLDGQRESRRIPEPHRHGNAGKPRKSLLFHQIEAADLYASLPQADLKRLEVDQANARKFIREALRDCEKECPAK